MEGREEKRREGRRDKEGMEGREKRKARKERREEKKMRGNTKGQVCVGWYAVESYLCRERHRISYSR